MCVIKSNTRWARVCVDKDFMRINGPRVCANSDDITGHCLPADLNLLTSS